MCSKTVGRQSAVQKSDRALRLGRGAASLAILLGELYGGQDGIFIDRNAVVLAQLFSGFVVRELCESLAARRALGVSSAEAAAKAL